MSTSIPTPAQVRAALKALSFADLQRIADRCRIPVMKLYRIKRGITADPGLDAVSKFWPHVRPKTK